MRFGLAAWGLRDTPEEKKFALAAELGVELLEISIAGYPKDFLQIDAGEKEIREEKRLAAEYGIQLSCACAGNDFTGEDVEEQIRNVERVLKIASRLGVGQLRIFAGFASDSLMDADRTENMLSALRIVREKADGTGITLAVETHGGVICEKGVVRHYASAATRPDFWKRMLETGVSILFDPANLCAAGAVDPADFFHCFREKIVGMHWKDFVGIPGGVRPAACGEGMVDWPRLLEATRSFEGPVLIEYEPVEDVADGMRRSLAFLRENERKLC